MYCPPGRNDLLPSAIDPSELYMKDENGIPRYCTDPSGRENYEMLNGKEILIKIDGTEIYARDKKLGRDIYPSIRGQKYFATDKFGSFFYAKKNEDEFYFLGKNNEEVMISPDHYAKLHSGAFIAPNYEKYRIGINNQEEYKYIESENSWRALFMVDGITKVPRYALSETKSFYFPYTYDFLVIKDDPLYPVTANGEITFPLKNQDEYYLKNSKNSEISSQLSKYAKLFNGKQLYPKEVTPQGEIEIILNQTYCRDEFNEYYLPIDEFGNEYVLENEPFIQKLDYPITSDNFIIVPEIHNKPTYFKLSEYDVKPSNLVAKLNRTQMHTKEKYIGPKDYLTNVKSKRVSRSINNTTYSLEKITPTYNYYLWVLIVLGVFTLLIIDAICRYKARTVVLK